MANTSVGTVAITMTLWLADLGAGHLQQPTTPPSDLASSTHAAAASKACQPGAATPSDDSDMEVVVCAKPVR